MKRLFTLVAALLVACAQSSTVASNPSPTAEEEPAATLAVPPSGALELSSTSCPLAAAHVYHSQRLHLLAGCRELSLRGVIESVKGERDGDFHIRLRLDAGEVDPKGGHYVNAENVRQQHGDLVLEPVCEQSVTQADAVSACQGYRNPLRLQPSGSHVIASGFWVFDAQHGWQELHPLTGLQKLP